MLTRILLTVALAIPTTFFGTPPWEKAPEKWDRADAYRGHCHPSIVPAAVVIAVVIIIAMVVVAVVIMVVALAAWLILALVCWELPVRINRLLKRLCSPAYSLYTVE
jgi:hypothetical protein